MAETTLYGQVDGKWTNYKIKFSEHWDKDSSLKEWIFKVSGKTWQLKQHVYVAIVEVHAQRADLVAHSNPAK